MGANSKKIKKLKRKLKDLRARLKKTAVAAVSPLAPPSGFPDIPHIDGVRFAAVEAGVRYSNRTDLTLIELAPGTTVAGVFTQSATRAAPVLDCQDKLGTDPEGGAAIIVNSGNANAFTGRSGRASVTAITSAVADTLGVPENRVYSASTGVIGEPLPHDRITRKIGELTENLSASAITDAARAIMTTDT